MSAQLRIALIASARYPIRQPFFGGLEAHTWALARGLRARDHQVTIFAGGDCDPQLDVSEIIAARLNLSTAARRDVSMTTEQTMAEHHAYLQLMLDLSVSDNFDVVHNNCLHHLPMAMARILPIPMIATLHTPPIPWLESAIQTGPCPVTFAAVSHHTARAWQPLVPDAQVIPNGVDPDIWAVGLGGGPALWSGRLVPEKGADLALRAAVEAGMSLDLAGPISDHRFFASRVEPLLDHRRRYVGHLDHRSLAARMREASVCVITPRWDEPYGLVAAEALACGTPVCGFARGALPEILSPEVSVLVPADDVHALAAAMVDAGRLPREAARSYALSHCSQDAMIDSYERLYHKVAA